MMRIRGVLAAVTATVAGAALLLAQPAAERGVTGTTITFGVEDLVNSFSADEENLGFRLAFQEANDHAQPAGFVCELDGGRGGLFYGSAHPRALVVVG